MRPEEVLAEWIDSYMNRLVRISYTYTGNKTSAEDCVQNAFIKAYRSMDQLSDISRPFPWLVRIVINESKMLNRRNWREIPGRVISTMRDVSAEEHHFIDLKGKEVHEAILSLPEKYRIPIVLFYFEDLSNKEISEVLRVSPATVRTWIFRGRKILKTILEEGTGDEFGPEITRC